MKTIGTKVMGIRTPIISQGDNLVAIVTDSIKAAIEHENIEMSDMDVVGVTEAVVARAQGNYATVEQIAKCVEQKVPDGVLGLVFPIFSRNRFSIVLKAIAMGVKKLYVLLSYPGDEVGNQIIDPDVMYDKGVNPYTDEMEEGAFRDIFGSDTVHRFTGVDYIDFYKSLSDNITVVFSNNPRTILKYTKTVLAADIHSRERTKRILKEAGAEIVFSLDEILNTSLDGSGYNAQYGVLGSNMAGDDKVKLFPRECDTFVTKLQASLNALTGKNIEVMVYGDGAFKDPVQGIWELADPVVSPAYTSGLEGLPNELKLKYLADTTLKDLKGKELDDAMREKIMAKNNNLIGTMESQGTTPRRLTDLLGSLCDLTSGSGDKGTPVVLIQGYFKNYSD